MLANPGENCQTWCMDRPRMSISTMEWVQELVPCRIKSIHIVNQPYIFNMLFSIFKPFLQEKLRNRIHFHGEDRASLLNHIDAKSVPTQFGGDMYLPHDQGLELLRLLCLYDDQYQKTSEYGYISKQKGKDKKDKRICET
uniref:CRAL-TRIO domain-containing protein n=1 Tax=Graphocephala atropunctata TaxID=36148 RepID=A0A1B6M5B7_9HEMI